MNPALEKNLNSLKSDIEFYKQSIREVSEDILNEKVSEYPIFIAHKEEIPIGELILKNNELATTWSISASTYEEFTEKNIIENDKTAFFKANYKKPSEFICIFLIYETSANFVFIPFENEK